MCIQGITFISSKAFMNSRAGMLNTCSIRSGSFPAIL